VSIVKDQKRLEIKIGILEDLNQRLKDEISEYEDRVTELEDEVEALKSTLKDQGFFSSTYPGNMFED